VDEKASALPAFRRLTIAALWYRRLGMAAFFKAFPQLERPKLARLETHDLKGRLIMRLAKRERDV